MKMPFFLCEKAPDGMSRFARLRLIMKISPHVDISVRAYASRPPDTIFGSTRSSTCPVAEFRMDWP